MAADAPVPFHRPAISREDRQAVDRVLRSGWLTTGAEAEQFEAEFAQAVGARHALAVSSCTAALHLALACCRLRPEDEVIVPTMTFTATAAAVLMAGARPVVADVDPETLTLTAETIIPVHTRHTRVLLPVHYGGTPAGFPGVLAFAHQYRQRVIDDAAHALPAATAAGPIGSEAVGSDATCFSFYATKTLTTGEGGMLTTRWPEWAMRARRLTLHGVDADAYQRSRTAVYHYEVVEHGYKYNLPDLLAALGRSQLARHRLLWASRRDTAHTYADGFAPLVARGLVRLPRLLPRQIALEMIATGDPIDATRAHALGLVNRVVPSEQVLDAALAIARSVVACAPIAVQEGLALARRAAELDDAAGRSATDAAVARVRMTEDFKEGPRAFLEKRAPVWKGR